MQVVQAKKGICFDTQTAAGVRAVLATARQTKGTIVTLPVPNQRLTFKAPLVLNLQCCSRNYPGDAQALSSPVWGGCFVDNVSEGWGVTCPRV